MLRGLSKSSDSARIRTFLAVELPDELKADLGSIGAQLKPFESILKVVTPDLLHVTLKFLGGVEQRVLPDVERVVTGAARPAEPFSLVLDTIGSFPAHGAPRVIWVGLNSNEGYRRLQSLFEVLDRSLEHLGFTRETRPFAPHITLARVRDGTPADATRELQEALARLKAKGIDHGRFDVSQLTVMRSELSPRGPTYTPIARVQLGGDGGS